MLETRHHGVKTNVFYNVNIRNKIANYDNDWSF